MRRKIAVTLAFLASLALLVDKAAYAQGQENEQNRTVSVSGEGIVRVQPDMAIVRFGVVTQDTDAEAARSQNAAAAREAMNAVRELGIEERYMRMETLRIQPIREYNPDTRQWIERGLEAIREVVVEVRDLELLPVLVAAVVEKGANRLNGVTYDLQNRDEARNEALRLAMINAREKARLLTSALETNLGQVLRINEQVFDFPRPMMELAYDRAAMSKEVAAPEPEAYAPGEIEVRSTVQVVFEIE